MVAAVLPGLSVPEISSPEQKKEASVRTLIAARRALVLCVFVAAASAPLQALSAKVFVTPLGKDSLTCGALLTPCKTLAGAVAVVSPGGTVVVLTSGEYGPVTIAKALTIEATGVTALIQSAGDAITVNAGSTDIVALKGLSLSNNFGGSGVLINSAGAVHIENCAMRGFINGVFAFQWSGRLSIHGTTARNGNAGVNLRSPGGHIDVEIDHCVFENNGVGINVQDGTRTVVRHSASSGNLHGISGQGSFGSALDLTVVDCVVSNNTAIGIASETTDPSSSTLVRVAQSTVTGNAQGFVQGTFGGGPAIFLSRGDNTVEGNTQGDLAGTIGTYSGK